MLHTLLLKIAYISLFKKVTKKTQLIITYIVKICSILKFIKSCLKKIWNFNFKYCLIKKIQFGLIQSHHALINY